MNPEIKSLTEVYNMLFDAWEKLSAITDKIENLDQIAEYICKAMSLIQLQQEQNLDD